MELNFQLPVGLHFGGILHKDVELLESNGIAEKIFTKKLADKPYTWQGNVLSAAIKSIGTYEIGAKVREEYLKSNAVTIPPVIEHLPLAEVNTLLIEIHRRCWRDVIPKQQFLCKTCAKQLVGDIDLKKISFTEEDKVFFGQNPAITHLIADLPVGFTIDSIKELSDEQFLPFKGIRFNRMTFRVPLLKDAIKNEKYASETIPFWRRIAFDCTPVIECVEDDKVVAELPSMANMMLGLKLYDLYLSSKDLHAIREALIGKLPTLSFFYEEECPCERASTIPFIMEATNFFSE